MDAELEEIIEAAKKHGLKRLRVGDIEVELWDKPRPASAQLQVFPETAGAKSLSEEEQYDEDLFYSAGV
tara:strand:+ start:1076 stop:1282 length:207 start_codon:yes stop_codon:yes gene_type:complete